MELVEKDGEKLSAVATVEGGAIEEESNQNYSNFLLQ